MNNLRNFLVGLVGLLFVAQLALVSPVSAQSPQQNERAHLSRVMDANANIEEFRQEYLDYLTELQDSMGLFNEIPSVREKLSGSDLKPISMISEAKRFVAELPSEDLIKIRFAYAKSPGWREMPQKLINPKLRQELETRLAAKKTGGEIMSEGIVDDCVAAITADVTNTDISIAKAASLAAHAITDVIPPVLNIPAVAAHVITDSALLVLETFKAIKDDCTGLDATAVQGIVDGAKTEIINNDNSNKNTIVTSLTNNTTTINNAITTAKTDIVNNDNTNKTTIVNNDNTNKTAIIDNATTNTSTLNTAITAAQTNINNTSGANTLVVTNAVTNAKNAIVANDNANTTTIVNNANANTTTLNTAITTAKNELLANANANKTELRDLLLRSQIEADLATESNGVKVAWYMTPTANGGHLDLVQAIVTETLANIQAAGGSIGNAQSFLTKATQDKAAGNFKSAYDNYRKAYKAAAN